MDPGSRTILARHEDNATAPHDALRSLQIVNHAKMTVHYHFHDHQHTGEGEPLQQQPVQQLGEGGTGEQGPGAQADTLDASEQIEPGEIREDVPLGPSTNGHRGMRTTNDQAPTLSAAAKRPLSETVPATTQVYLPPSKRIKEESNGPSSTNAPMDIHSLQARFGNPQGREAPARLAPPVDPRQSKGQPALPWAQGPKQCRHCKVWFEEKDNNDTACGVHSGTFTPNQFLNKPREGVVAKILTKFCRPKDDVSRPRRHRSGNWSHRLQGLGLLFFGKRHTGVPWKTPQDELKPVALFHRRFAV